MHTLSQIARDLGVSTTIISKWIERDDFKEWFSEGARIKGAGRVLSDDDVDVLLTIGNMRRDNSRWDSIVYFLKSGQRIVSTHPSALGSDTRVVAYAHAEQAVKASATMAERDSAIQRIGELETEIKALRREHATEMKERFTELRHMERLLGIAEGKLEMYEKAESG